MSSISLTAQTRGDQVLSQSFAKLVAIVYGLRSSELDPAGMDDDERKMNKWFSLYIREPDFTRPLLATYRNLSSDASLVLDVILDTSGIAANHAVVVTTPDRNEPVTQKTVLLERYTLSFRNGPPGQSADDSNLQVRTAYKQLRALFRTLYALVLMLPAQSLLRRSRNTQQLRIATRVASTESGSEGHYGDADPSKRASFSAFDTLLTPHDSIESISFPAVATGSGSLALSVRYRLATQFAVLDSDTVLSSRLIDQDFFKPTVHSVSQRSSHSFSQRSSPHPSSPHLSASILARSRGKGSMSITRASVPRTSSAEHRTAEAEQQSSEAADVPSGFRTEWTVSPAFITDKARHASASSSSLASVASLRPGSIAHSSSPLFRSASFADASQSVLARTDTDEIAQLLNLIETNKTTLSQSTVLNEQPAARAESPGEQLEKLARMRGSTGTGSTGGIGASVRAGMASGSAAMPPPGSTPSQSYFSINTSASTALGFSASLTSSTPSGNPPNPSPSLNSAKYPFSLSSSNNNRFVPLSPSPLSTSYKSIVTGPGKTTEGSKPGSPFSGEAPASFRSDGPPSRRLSRLSITETEAESFPASSRTVSSPLSSHSPGPGTPRIQPSTSTVSTSNLTRGFHQGRGAAAAGTTYTFPPYVAASRHRRDASASNESENDSDSSRQHQQSTILDEPFGRMDMSGDF